MRDPDGYPVELFQKPQRPLNAGTARGQAGIGRSRPWARRSGQLAVVTGAASGIGEAIARRLLAAGARVVAVDINERGLAPLVDAGATALVADLADPDGRARVVEPPAAARTTS